MAKETMLSFPDYTRNVNVYAESNYQMGGAVIQDKQLLVFFSCKFSPTQSKCTTIEQELLGIVETMK